MHIRSTKTPTLNRISCLIVALGQLVATPVRAQAPWTDERVSAHARERAPVTVAAHGTARRAQARVEGVGLHPNPFLDWERQETFSPNAQSQDVLRAHIPFDLSGRRDAARLLAELDAEDSRAGASSVGQELAARALGLFYAALALERRTDLLREAQGVLDEVSRVLSSRQAAGEASGYERARLALEAELGRSRLERASAERAVTIQELAALLGADEARATVRGDFEVADPAPLDELMARARESHPLLRSLEVQVDLARRARSAADTAWIPRFEIFGGYNLQIGPQAGHGYAVGVVLDVPVFDRGQGEQAEASAALSSLSDYEGALRAAMRASVAAARARLEAALTERRRFAAATGDDTGLLLRAASSGYRGGERTLVELLDARRAVLEVAERELTLDLTVRLADVELRRTTGAL